jgi:hypothetical protein
MYMCPIPNGFRDRAISLYSSKIVSRAIGQAVSRRLPIADARVRVRVRSYGICGGRSGTGAGFLQLLRFPLPILIPPTAPHSPSSIIWDWYNRPISVRRTKWTQSHSTTRKHIVDKKEILRTASNTGIFCSSDKVDIFYLIHHIFENSTVNISVLCNSCEDMACCSSDCILTLLYTGDNTHSSVSETVSKRKHVQIHFLA